MTTLTHVRGADTEQVEKQVDAIAQTHGGRFDDVSDKGVYYIFPDERAARRFIEDLLKTDARAEIVQEG